MSPWPHPPAGISAVGTAKGNPTFGIHAVNGQTSQVRLKPGDKVVITGLGFTQSGRVLISGHDIYLEEIVLSPSRWSPERIDATVPSLSHTRDQLTQLHVMTSNGDWFDFSWVVLHRP
jgi:hypothetical protein